MKRKLTKRQLQSLVGVLSFASTVVKGGRTFTRRIIDSMNKLRRPHHKTRINKEFRKDLLWWSNFAATFNGKAKIIRSEPLPQCYLQTDASFSGYGAYFHGDWVAGTWHPDAVPQPSEIRNLPWWNSVQVPTEISNNINYLELFPVLLAAQKWSSSWQNQHVVVHSDNTQTISFINKGTCHNVIAMEWLRDLFWLSATHNFHITARHLLVELNCDLFCQRDSKVTKNNRC